MVIWAPSLVVKLPAWEADHSVPTSAEAKNGGGIPSLFHVFMACSLIKHKNNYLFFPNLTAGLMVCCNIVMKAHL
jgi:hypothetical protein